MIKEGFGYVCEISSSDIKLSVGYSIPLGTRVDFTYEDGKPFFTPVTKKKVKMWRWVVKSNGLDSHGRNEYYISTWVTECGVIPLKGKYDKPIRPLPETEIEVEE